MTLHYRCKYLYIFFWFFVIKNDANIINTNTNNEGATIKPVYFRWSKGFELNGEELRCATDLSSEDPSNHFLDAYPEMKDDVYFPRAPDGSQRYRCDSNSSLLEYNPQTRRIHLVGNGHCLVVNRWSHHMKASRFYPINHFLKSIDCKRAAKNESTSDLIWGSEFRLVHTNNQNNNVAIRFISPSDGHEWTIYILVTNLIVADETQEVMDRLGKPVLEIIDDYTSDILMTY